MGTRWERAELQRSRDRGVWDRWGVQDAERRDQWVHFAFDQRRIYAPLEHHELAHHFARIGQSEETLLPFVWNYGRLGWDKLRGEPNLVESDLWFRRAHRTWRELVREGIVYAEPVDWIVAHARTVGWCLNAGLALGLPDKQRRHRMCEQLSRALPKPTGLGGSLTTEPLLREGTIKKVPPVDFVGKMLEDYLWINLRGVRRRVEYSGGRIRSIWGGESLLESIYTIVTDTVTGGRLAQCRAKDCGAVFVQTDERQRFCPPRVGQVKSACMNRERVRRFRQKEKKEGAQDGKAKRTRRG